MASLISSTTWIRRGVPAQHPKRYTLDQNELERVSRMAGSRLAQVKDLLEAQVEAEEVVDVEDMIAGETDDDEPKDNPSERLSSNPHQTTDGEWTDEDSPGDDMDVDMNVEQTPQDHPAQQANDDLAQYNLDSYDQEESKGVSMGAFSNIKGLQYYQDSSEDPYITLDNKTEDDTTEREELEIYPTDNLLVAAKTEDGVSQLDVYVYDESEENLYIHHDILLPSMPLCLEWIDFTPAGISCEDSSRKGSFIAVGTMDPDIEIWNLDVIDGLYPDAILGANCPDHSDQDPQKPEPNKSNKKMKKKTKRKIQALSKPEPTSQIFPTHHSSSVLSLSHNKLVRNLLLSSSADTTIKLWDLNVAPAAPSSTFTAIRSFGLHHDKVQSALWNPKEPSVVLSGGWDSLIKVWDSRNSSEGVHVKVESDVECLRWDPFHPQAFIVSLDNGLIQSYDSRMLSNFTDSTPKSKPLWTLSAHDSSVSAMDISPVVPGLLITGGVDKMVKVWNLAETSGTPSLSMVVGRDLGVGKVFSVGFCPDDATTVAVAGSKASLQIWDLATNDGVRSIFGERLKQHANLNVEKRKTIGNGGVLGVVDEIETDDEDS